MRQYKDEAREIIDDVKDLYESGHVEDAFYKLLDIIDEQNDELVYKCIEIKNYIRLAHILGKNHD